MGWLVWPVICPHDSGRNPYNLRVDLLSAERSPYHRGRLDAAGTRRNRAASVLKVAAATRQALTRTRRTRWQPQVDDRVCNRRGESLEVNALTLFAEVGREAGTPESGLAPVGCPLAIGG